MPRKKIGLLLVAGLLAVSGTGGVTAVSTAKDSKACTVAKRQLAIAKKKKLPAGKIRVLQKMVDAKCKK